MKMGAALAGLAITVTVLAVLSLSSAQAQSSGTLTAQSPALTAEQARALKNPVPFTRESIAAGRLLYFSNGCTNCHGADGKALIDILANATDLTDPKFWNYGTEPGQIFKSLRDGWGASMPPFKGTISKETDLWNLVNFIQSLWPADRQPKP
ncbi:MAG: c-type cytochrome [Alphaproteobacteria bacterium]